MIVIVWEPSCLEMIDSWLIPSQDKDVSEATAHMVDLARRLQDLEAALNESCSQENRLQRDVEGTKRRYREYRHQNTSLRGELAG